MDSLFAVARPLSQAPNYINGRISCYSLSWEERIDKSFIYVVKVLFCKTLNSHHLNGIIGGRNRIITGKRFQQIEFAAAIQWSFMLIYLKYIIYNNMIDILIFLLP